MKFETTSNGNLRISLEGERDEQDIRSILENRGGDDVFALIDILEYAGMDEEWARVPPRAIGALTDAPILTDEFSIADDGEFLVYGQVWWFPNYCLESFAETLLNEGTVIFTKA